MGLRSHRWPAHAVVMPTRAVVALFAQLQNSWGLATILVAAVALMVATLSNATVQEPTGDVTVHAVEGEEECSTLGVAAFYVVGVVGVTVIARGVGTGCCLLLRMGRRLFLNSHSTEQLRSHSPKSTADTVAVNNALLDGPEADSPSPPLFPGSDMTGQDAKNLIVALCRMHNCTDRFVAVLLTLVGGVILPVGNTLNIVDGLSPVSINADAKEFFVDCEGKIHLKKRMCLRGRRAALLQDRCDDQ